MRDCPAKWRKSVFIFTMTLTLLFFIVAYTYYISIERSWFEPFKKFPLSFSEPVQTVQKPVQTQANFPEAFTQDFLNENFLFLLRLKVLKNVHRIRDDSNSS